MDALTQHVKNEIGKPFVWGERDCLTFANEALRVHHGFGPFDPFIEQVDWGDIKTAIAAFRKWKELYPDGIIGVADSTWDRICTMHPRHGFLVGRQVKGGAPMSFAFGVVVHGHCVFVEREGVTATPPVTHDMFWRIVDC